jgi:anti-anti-sigma factor
MIIAEYLDVLFVYPTILQKKWRALMSEIIREEGKTIVKPGENIVAKMAQQFRKELLCVLEEGCKELVVDLRSVTRVDSIGIGILIATCNTLNESDGKLTVINVSKDIYQLLKAMRLDQHFKVKMIRK